MVYAYNREMNWSPDLSYVVGLITTDGNLSKDGRHITFVSKDIDQINNFIRILNLDCKICTKKGSYSNTKLYYYIQFSNVILYRFLLSIGLMPNKTKIIRELAIPNEYFADFLRGHLDGDGYTYSHWDKRWTSSFRLYTIFMSASLIHLQWIRMKILEIYGISGKLNYYGRSVYYLVFAKVKSSLLLRFLYYNKDVTCLKRKLFKIESALGIISKQAGVEKLVYSLPWGGSAVKSVQVRVLSPAQNWYNMSCCRDRQDGQGACLNNKL